MVLVTGFESIQKGINGARSRSRTGTTFRSRDFKSLASTNFATRSISVIAFYRDISEKKMEAEGGIEPPSTALQAAA